MHVILYKIGKMLVLRKCPLKSHGPRCLKAWQETKLPQRMRRGMEEMRHRGQ